MHAGRHACATLAHAVDIAAEGDTIQFGPGHFAANTAMIPKTLTFLGAKAGVPGNQRNPADPAETVLEPTGDGLHVGATDTVIDGLVFSGSASWALRTTGLVGNDRKTGYKIRNNIFIDNHTGMYLRDGLFDVSISDNLFVRNGLEGSTDLAMGIYADDSADDVTITRNEFRGNAMSASVVPTENGGKDVTYSDNVSIDDAHGVNFARVDGLRIIDNTFRGGAEGGISLVGYGLDGLVEGNLITEKGSYGINLNTYGAPENGKITIRENTILDTRAANGGAGMAITTAAKSFSEPLTIEYNRIVDSAKIGLRNRETTEVDARRNWWGCNLGPGTKGCDSVVAEGDGVLPDFAPWLTLSLSLHDATSSTPSGETISGPIEAGGSATLFARDANLSSGGLADGPFFREAPVTFASDPAGATLNPVNTTLSNNAVTATSAFTANLRPIEWSVTLDHQIVRLFNPDSSDPSGPSGPSGPCVVPTVVPSDRTLTRRQRVVITIGLVNRCTQTARRLRVCTRRSAKLNYSGKRCRLIASLRPGHTLVLRVRARVRPGACRGPLAPRVRLRVAGQPQSVRRAVMRLIARRCGPPPAVTG